VKKTIIKIRGWLNKMPKTQQWNQHSASCLDRETRGKQGSRYHREKTRASDIRTANGRVNRATLGMRN